MDRANINELISFNYELLIEIETNCAAAAATTTTTTIELKSVETMWKWNG